MGPRASDSEWAVDEADFSGLEGPAERLAFLVRYAILAPSSHNSQPWRFRIDEDSLELLIDRSRVLTVVDPDDRELVMSCGAALFHLRVALRHFGYLGDIRTIPPPEFFDGMRLRTVPERLARVRLGARAEPSPDDELLFRAIPRRHTNRSAFPKGSFAPALLDALVDAASEEGSWLEFVEEDESRATLADLIAEADREQFADRRFRAELAAWLRPNHTTARDGMPGYALGLHELESMLGPFVVRTFDRGDGQAAKDRALAEGSPLLAVIGTREDHPSAWLNAGQALDRVLLRAAASNLSASFLNQPLEIARLRPRVGELVRREGHPQVILRMGVGPEVRPTPRRPAEEVIERV